MRRVPLWLLRGVCFFLLFFSGRTARGAPPEKALPGELLKLRPVDWLPSTSRNCRRQARQKRSTYRAWCDAAWGQGHQREEPGGPAAPPPRQRLPIGTRDTALRSQPEQAASNVVAPRLLGRLPARDSGSRSGRSAGQSGRATWRRGRLSSPKRARDSGWWYGAGGVCILACRSRNSRGGRTGGVRK